MSVGSLVVIVDDPEAVVEFDQESVESGTKLSLVDFIGEDGTRSPSRTSVLEDNVKAVERGIALSCGMGIVCISRDVCSAVDSSFSGIEGTDLKVTFWPWVPLITVASKAPCQLSS